MSYTANDIEKEIKGSIYIITNDINNLVYIGQTCESLQKRFGRHCRNNNDSKDSIDYDINLYGKEHFKIKLIEKIPIEQLDEKEIYWIKFYDSYKKGYNRTAGGMGSRLYSPEQINEAINLYYQGLTFENITKITGISASTFFKYLNNNNFEKRKFTENQYKSSVNNFKKATLTRQIKIKNIDLNIIYSSKKEALIDMINKGYSKALDWHNIRMPLDRALQKKQLTFLNFKWEIIDE